MSAYAPIAARNADGAYAQPTYVGKAIPKGGRKGGLSADAAKGRALADRIAQHAASIEQATNLDTQDFLVRYLVVDDIWIPLGENMLIETFKPLWNSAMDLETGTRVIAARHSIARLGMSFTQVAPSQQSWQKAQLTKEFLERQVSDYLAGRPLEKLPKALEDQQAAVQAEAEQSADEV
nr:Eco29kI family restriction endonuclease [Mesorhizobium sp. LSJC269B00]